MLGGAFLLVAMSAQDTVVIRNLRAALTDVVTPVMSAVTRPADAISEGAVWLQEMVDLRAENARLRAQNAELLHWQAAAREMQVENSSLRNLLSFSQDVGISYVSGRIVTGNNGPFTRSALVNVGSSDGINRYQPVVTEKGLAGRIMETGYHSARVLLLTDINSHIPVMTEHTRERGILSGNNTDTLTLNHLPDDSKAAMGERVVTAGDGGVLPAGIPVGVITATENGQTHVKPLAEDGRMEYVSVIQYQF